MVKDAVITVFRNIFDKNPFYITVETALTRIRDGASKDKIAEIRTQLDKERADSLKANLPSVCFAGKFSARFDDKLITHSGLIVLDFDNLEDLRSMQEAVINTPWVVACWVSPRGNGLKVLARIADGSKHREHFDALLEQFPDMDKSCRNESRVCYESYDPEIYINYEATAYTKTKKVEVLKEIQVIEEKREIFNMIMKWLSNKGDAFVTGERNNFIFKLASACCRFGLSVDETLLEITAELSLADGSFSLSEAKNAIKSAYKANKAQYGSARFDKEVLVDKVTLAEVKVDVAFYDPNVKPKDVIYGEDVKAGALALYDKGYERVDGIGIYELDKLFKYKRGEISLLSGYGNYGKTTFWLWFILMRILKFGEKFAFFSPENNPAEEFYHDFAEILLGCDCTPSNPHRPAKLVYEAAYDWVSKYVFYVYPAELAPTPEYIKERFLELIIKEKIDGCIIDPFNQLTNDYGRAGRSDKYLETFLSDIKRFALANDIFLTMIAHPKGGVKKDPNGNYPAPDVFDLADGAMWNNKMDDIMIYHKPLQQTDPEDATCDFYTKKIRKQKSVGKRGLLTFEYYRPTRRFRFAGKDPMRELLERLGLDFTPKQAEMEFDGYKPVNTEGF